MLAKKLGMKPISSSDCNFELWFLTESRHRNSIIAFSNLEFRETNHSCKPLVQHKHPVKTAMFSENLDFEEVIDQELVKRAIVTAAKGNLGCL